MRRRQFLAFIPGTALIGLAPNLLFADMRLLDFVGAADSPPFSFDTPDGPSGYLIEVIKACFSIEPAIDNTITLFPWSRAQWMVKNGAADLFCTFPSIERQEYALFTQNPAFTWTFGNLVYRKDNPAAEQIAAATSWDDLKDLTFIGQHETGWEDDNVPSFVERIKFSDQEEMLQVLLRRGLGDFLIMSPIEANYLLETMSLGHLASQTSADFIENSDLPFHIGIRKDHPHALSLIDALDERLVSSEFARHVQRIDQRYTQS